jgi:acetyl esterase/lipase
LISPPPGSFHEPVPASKIIFCGDSAGGNLSLALLQLLLQLHHMEGQTPKVRFYGQEIEVPLPGGVACSSAWVDLTRTMPSIETNHKWDYLPAINRSSMNSQFPECSIWPSNPRREDIYCDATMMVHPFASPLASKGSDWEGSPPIYLFYGQEMLTDEGKYLARKLARQGIAVEWEEYEAMPHCFSMLISGTPTSNQAMNSWAGFIARVGKGERIETRGRHYSAPGLVETLVDVRNLGDLTESELDERMSTEAKRRGGLATGNVKSKL